MKGSRTLPKLTNTPTAHPDSCLAISTILIDLLESATPATNQHILSIGSGTGILEVLLAERLSTKSSETLVCGVEPHPGTANKYLDKDNLLLVSGTWAVLPAAKVLSFGLWLFVYPRETRLVKEYVNMMGAMEGIGPETIIWAGPAADWVIFKDEFEHEAVSLTVVHEGPKGGVADWEVVAVYARSECGHTDQRVGNMEAQDNMIEDI